MPVQWMWKLSLVSCSLMLLSGCQSAGEGPERFTLTGTAYFKGEPIPFGRILLQPDNEQGNKGPAGVADIKNGQFHTREGKGHVGGPHQVLIMATDGTQPASADVDNSLFAPVKLSVTLPKENTTCDFIIPEETQRL